MSLQGKKIILGVTGSIAAYKSAFLTRLLVKSGAEVQLIMSTSAFDFITPLSLATLSGKPVLSKFQKNDTGEWNNHVELGIWADLLLVAPTTANTLAKFAHGTCDNLLSAVYLSSRCPVMIAPAMDLDMYQHPATRANLKTLESYGNIILPAESGELASGLSGQGRMMEPDHIVAEIQEFFKRTSDFSQKKVLITMGPTQEALDPVRFISNHSSGKMGAALAKAFIERGADVHVISGPISLPVNKSSYHWTDVKSAAEMYEKAVEIAPNMDICIFSAAVADYAPLDISQEKIKKTDDNLSILLKKNKDIASSLGKMKRPHQIHVGFALETDNEEQNAKRKLISKNFDMIVLNSMQDKGAGFGGDTNKVRIYKTDGPDVISPLTTKNRIAELILDQIKTIPVWV